MKRTAYRTTTAHPKSAFLEHSWLIARGGCTSSRAVHFCTLEASTDGRRHPKRRDPVDELPTCLRASWQRRDHRFYAHPGTPSPRRPRTTSGGRLVAAAPVARQRRQCFARERTIEHRSQCTHGVHGQHFGAPSSAVRELPSTSAMAERRQASAGTERVDAVQCTLLTGVNATSTLASEQASSRAIAARYCAMSYELHSTEAPPRQPPCAQPRDAPGATTPSWSSWRLSSSRAPLPRSFLVEIGRM